MQWGIVRLEEICARPLSSTQKTLCASSFICGNSLGKVGMPTYIWICSICTVYESILYILYTVFTVLKTV